MLELILHTGTHPAFVESGVNQFFEDPTGVTLAVTLWILLLGGSLLMLLASVGLIRLPDLPTRMHASTKAGTLGAALIMLAVAVAMPSADVWARSIAVIAFLLLTAPVAAHVIGRAGYFVGVPLWEGTVKDELAEKYDFKRHTLASGSLDEREIDGLDTADDGDEEDTKLEIERGPEIIEAEDDEGLDESSDSDQEESKELESRDSSAEDDAGDIPEEEASTESEDEVFEAEEPEESEEAFTDAASDELEAGEDDENDENDENDKSDGPADDDADGEPSPDAKKKDAESGNVEMQGA